MFYPRPQCGLEYLAQSFLRKHPRRVISSVTDPSVGTRWKTTGL